MILPVPRYDQKAFYCSIPTPLGLMHACASSDGICMLEFAGKDASGDEIGSLLERSEANIYTGANKHLLQLKDELAEYFAGKRKEFEVRLDVSGTDFQKSVWDRLRDIPYGKTYSYQEQAVKLENADAIRAVASANGQNRIAIVIPCHRVIGKNGKLTGYAGGLERKQWLLDHERKHAGLPGQMSLL